MRFLFAPASTRPLALLRVALAGVLFVQALCVAHLVLELWSSAGLMQTALGDYLTGGDLMWFTGLRGLVARLGVPEDLWVRGVFAAYVGSLVALVAAPRRATAVAACALHAFLMAGGSLSSYGVDQFAQAGLFALVIEPAETPPWKPAPPTVSARVALRCLQGTLCLAYLGSGLAKARGHDWWTGDAMYRALTMPCFTVMDTTFLVRMPWIAKLASWSTLALEVGYPALMASPRTRKPAVLAVIAMHAGIGLLMQLHSFALTMALLTLVAFGLPAEEPPITA